ncbi:3'(2'),5'-bisphosphate nucleotidase CysQ [Histidinibacterium lentulum]|uniref:3'(2'),5'-bisphosphate nucleotidase CysQ n=1 Tax=Histidinibacterium lentulum TaxID=2480588 RepID=A0A3N2R6B5_9RHOB|nr:3'(2'),5'-bisphosphate nucleotidase CysQ [Histidinibacterium lentulum]ROU02974.1 3'(2'),5'-bisphosphate nucleotidase CysQ [Histidinibacterium lentulum]
MRETDAEDLSLIIAAAEAAGEIACRHHGAAPKTWDKGDGQGPVTEADLEVDALLKERLTAARPGYGWLSEESAGGPDRLTSPRQFIVDPIDGTRAFIEGGRDWSHSIAVAEGGRIVAAAVFVPMRDALYSAGLNGGAAVGGTPLQVSDESRLGRANVLANRPSMAAEHWAGGEVPPVKRHFRSSLAYRLCLVAQGRFDAMLTLRPTWEWDVAAGSLIVEEAGGTVSDRTGGRPEFNRAVPQIDGIVAAGAVHGGLMAALA